MFPIPNTRTTYLRSSIRIITLLFLLTVAFVMLQPSTSSAREIFLRLNGVALQTDVAPEIRNGRTMVPVRIIAEQFGAQIEWDQETQQVHIRRGDDEIVLTIGQNTARVGSEQVALDAAPYIKSGRTMVPLRFIAETFGAEVSWDAENYVVMIKRMSPIPLPEEEKKPDKTVTPADRDPQADQSGESGWFAVTDHRVGQTSELIKISGVQAANYNAFWLYEPTRFVVDVPITSDFEEAAILRLPEASLYVQSIRTGSPENGTARFVFDMRQVVDTHVTLTGDELIVQMEQSALPLTGLRIMLDAGHGGPDPGAIGPGGTLEKNVNLAITEKTATYLTQMGAQVYRTRTGDQGIGLYERAGLANELRVDLFISIHNNATENRTRSGTETYIHPSKPESRPLAEFVQSAVANAIGSVDRGVFQANFVVIRETYMPAILVEGNYLSNPTVEPLLASDQYQDKIARGIAEGVRQYWLSLRR